jgi:signal transduction histidine kinase
MTKSNIFTKENVLRCPASEFAELSQLRKKLHEAEEQNREIKDRVLQILMVLSHDLRGPLTSLSAGLQLLVRGRYGTVDENVAHELKGLLKQTVRLSGVVEDHLTRAAVMDGFGEIEKEALDLKQDIIDPVLEELAFELISRGITVGKSAETVPSGAVTIYAGRRWLRSVYRNLITNAIRYGGRGGEVVLGCEDHGRHYRLNVYNSGEPVPGEFREKLFTKFGRIGNTAGNANAGTGLGLYLVREIIRMHGGNIWYEAAKTGSNFIFTMPKGTSRAHELGLADREGEENACCKHHRSTE